MGKLKWNKQFHTTGPWMLIDGVWKNMKTQMFWIYGYLFSGQQGNGLSGNSQRNLT